MSETELAELIILDSFKRQLKERPYEKLMKCIDSLASPMVRYRYRYYLTKANEEVESGY